MSSILRLPAPRAWPRGPLRRPRRAARGAAFRVCEEPCSGSYPRKQWRAHQHAPKVGAKVGACGAARFGWARCLRRTGGLTNVPGSGDIDLMSDALVSLQRRGTAAIITLDRPD